MTATRHLYVCEDCGERCIAAGGWWHHVTIIQHAGLRAEAVRIKLDHRARPERIRDLPRRIATVWEDER